MSNKLHPLTHTWGRSSRNMTQRSQFRRCRCHRQRAHRQECHCKMRRVLLRMKRLLLTCLSWCYSLFQRQQLWGSLLQDSTLTFLVYRSELGCSSRSWIGSAVTFRGFVRGGFSSSILVVETFSWRYPLLLLSWSLLCVPKYLRPETFVISFLFRIFF